MVTTPEPTPASVSVKGRSCWTSSSSGSSSSSGDDVQQKATVNEMNQVLAMYHDSTVLITGGTGFLGKVLLEKALRCLSVRKIFLLIRRKDNLGARERLERLLQDPVFEKVRSCYPTMQELFTKVEAVQIDLNNSTTLFPGDENKHDMDGDGDDDTLSTEERLLAETEIIFNVLASVKFNESIRNALATNVGGTGKVLQLAKRMPQLRSVVHVSTLYSNCHRSHIEERVYDDIPMDHGMILQLTNALSEQEMDRFQHCFLGPMPNTYTFSKKCAEVMIQKDYSQLPIGIFRPPIVISTYQEPMPGWTDNLNGPSGVCMWTVKGLIHTIWGSAGKRANLVPVDYCVNAIIVAAYDIWRRGQIKDGEGCGQLLPTYNYMYPASSLTWGKYMDMVHLGFESRLHQMVWNYSYIITSYRPLFRALSFCFHTVPAIVLDVLQRIRQKPPIYQRAMQKTDRFLELMSYFGTREWTIANENVQRLRRLLSPEEGRLLEFDMGTINWAEYFRTYIPGIRRYWFREGAICGDRWRPAAYRRFQFMKRLVQKLLWICVCLRVTRVTSKFVVENLFALLIA